jgi:uracil-DNA glycosylase family 4
MEEYNFYRLDVFLSWLKNKHIAYWERILAGTLENLENKVIVCRRCPRLVEWRERVGCEKRKAFQGEEYWARPVPGFGDERARVLAVGLAPGAHGSNRTGRMFTGDASGDFLFPALHRIGFANQTHSVGREDGLALRDLFVTAVCRCVPPENKPTPQEIGNCLPYLREELRLLGRVRVIVALGKIAYDAAIRLFRERDPLLPPPPFSHGAIWRVRESDHRGMSLWILASYHPSRQNTQTGKLTRAMFDRIWRKAARLAQGGGGR